jgi:hypothetical protein
MVGIGGTSLLARDTKDGIHVVVTHVGSLSGNVFRTEGNWKSLLTHCGCGVYAQTKQSWQAVQSVMAEDK